MIIQSINDYVQNKNVNQEILSCLEAPNKEQIARMSRQVSDLDNQIAKLLNRSASTADDRLAQRYETEANTCIETQDNLNAKIAELEAQNATLQSLTTNIVQGKQLTEADVFTSLEVSREIIRVFIDRINVDEDNDDIEIIFKQ